MNDTENKFEDNPMTKIVTVSGGYIRHFFQQNNGYRMPITLEEIGFGKKLIGIKCVLYDPSLSLE